MWGVSLWIPYLAMPLGFGLFGHRAPAKLRLLSTSIVNHFFYGFGIWWIAALLPLG